MKSLYHLGALAIGVTCLLLHATPAAAQGTRDWADGAGKPIGLEDFIPEPSDAEAYIERYTFSVDLDGGGWIGTKLTISNLGMGDKHAAARVTVELPERKKKYEYNKKVSADAWKSSSEALDLRVAGVELTGQDDRHFQIRFEEPGGDVKVHLDFENVLPMWRPGNGRIDVEGGYLEYEMLAPRANVTGKVFIDGSWRKIKSSARSFADHSATDIAPFDFAKRFSRFRAYNDDVTIAWREIKLEEEWGGKSLTWVVVGYKDDIVFSDARAEMRMGRVSRDNYTGYTVPYAVQVDGKSGKDRVKLVLRGRKLKRQDLLESYGAAARMVAGAVSKPFRYDFRCRYTLQMTIKGATATVQGDGSYSFDYVNL